MGCPTTLSYLTLKGQSQDHSDFKALHLAKGAQLGHVFTIKHLQKIYGESIDVITFDCCDLERSISKSLRFRRFLSRKGADSGHVLLLNTNTKSHMGNLTAPSYLTLNDLERLNSRSLRFGSLIPCKKEQGQAHVLLNTNRKAYMGSPMTLSHLTLTDPESSISRLLRFQKLISRKGTALGHILQLNINKKPYMGVQ